MQKRRKKNDATCAWANEEKIFDIYEEARRLTHLTGEQYTVDHIDPLNHPLVCGFHHEDNLQVLHWVDNSLKANKFNPYRIEFR